MIQDLERGVHIVRIGSSYVVSNLLHCILKNAGVLARNLDVANLQVFNILVEIDLSILFMRIATQVEN